MAPESVIVSAIESLDSFLHKKPELLEENLGKLCSLLFVKKEYYLCNLREYMKETLYSLLVGVADFREDNKEKLYNFLSEIAYFNEDSMTKLHFFVGGIADASTEVDESDLYNLLRGFLKEYEEKLSSLLVEMTDFNWEKMHSLLVGMVDFWEDRNSKKHLYSLLVWVAVLPDSDLHNKEKMYSFLVEMAELWEDDDGRDLDKERLHTLLHEITDLTIDYYSRQRVNSKLYEKKMYSLMADIAGVCRAVNGRLDKEKVYTWLANKAELWDHNGLFRLLFNVAFSDENKDADGSIRDAVEGIIDELRSMLDFLKGNKWLHSFALDDAVEMARNAQALVEFRDSDPFIIYLILNHKDHEFESRDRRRFSGKIHAIKNWIQETRERVLQIGAETKSQNVRELELGEGHGVGVGLEEDLELLRRTSNLRPYTKPSRAPLRYTNATHTTLIRGMGGIGKTTLARSLYNHGAIVDEFECRAWVCVSWESSRKEVLMKLIQQAVNDKEFERDVEHLEKMDNEGLKQMLRQHLQGRRYFIVLDDVWNNTFLNYIRKALPKDIRSRLLLTTRCVDVKSDSRTDYDHTMKFLDEDKSWELLLKTMFSGTSDQQFPKHLEKRGRKMLAKCNGLPLAIKEVGRQWAQKRQLMSEWDEVIESVDLSATLEALEATYQNMDPQEKSRFLHLSVFKEGAAIKSRKLNYYWFLGGAVSEEEKYSGKSISELARASIIEETEEKGNKTCRVNAVFYKLSVKKAEEEMRLEIIRKDGSNRVCDKPRHRVIYCGREETFTYSRDQNSSHLVSLFFYGGGYFDVDWNHFEQLRILDMEGFGLQILPEAVGMLTELRYLGLRNNHIQKLPSSLSCLKYLEVLDIALNFMMEVADVIWEIASLLHLYMSDIICLKPMKIGTLKNLQTLTYISINDDLSGMEMLSGLRRLGVEELDRNSDISKLFASLAKVKNLDHLILRGFRYRSMPPLEELGVLGNLRELKLEGRLESLPSADNLPQRLRYLTLVDSSLDEDPMPILGNLEYLEYLKLQNAYIGQQMVIPPAAGVHSNRITHLVLAEMWNLRNILVKRRDLLSYLTQLEIINCPYLESFLEDTTWYGDEELNLLTTENIAKKILGPDFNFPQLCKLKILP